MPLIKVTLILFGMKKWSLLSLFLGAHMLLQAGTSPFVIEKEEVVLMLTERGIPMPELLQELVLAAKGYARPPISGYHVGIAALGKSGNIYLGVNLEFPGLPLNESVHGEQFLVVNARGHGEKELVLVAQSAPPCGHCRQFFHEMGVSDTLQILTPDGATATLASLLPNAFGPKDLGLAATLMEVSESDANDAVKAALESYSPYTGLKSGVLIEMKDGSIFTGSYIENAAYNPSLSPMHTALIALVVGMQSYRDIVHVTLAESTSAPISQESVVRNLLSTIAPEAPLECIKF